MKVVLVSLFANERQDGGLWNDQKAFILKRDLDRRLAKEKCVVAAASLHRDEAGFAHRLLPRLLARGRVEARHRLARPRGDDCPALDRLAVECGRWEVKPDLGTLFSFLDLHEHPVAHYDEFLVVADHVGIYPSLPGTCPGTPLSSPCSALALAFSPSFMSSPSPSARLADRFPLPVIVAAAVVIGMVYGSAAQTHYTGGGDAPYHILASRAWFGGQGFNPGDLTQTKYPPGWSLVLGAAGLAIGNTYEHFARFTAALFPLVLAATWLFVRRRAGSTVASAITAAVALSPACFIAATRGARSEVLFTAAALGFLAWAERAFAEPRISVVRILTGTALLVAAIMLRTIGVALLLATVATIVHLALFDRPRARRVGVRAALPVCAGVLALGLWTLMRGAPPPERYPGEHMNLYDNQFALIDPHRPGLGAASVADILARIPENLRLLTAHASEMLTNLDWVSPLWTSPLLVAVVVLLGAGVLRELRRSVPLPAYYLLGYVGVLTLWPFDEGQRFLVPIFPLLALFAFSGGRTAARFVRSRGTLCSRILLAVCVIQIGALLYARITTPEQFERQSWAALAIWILAATLLARFGSRPGDPSHSVNVRRMGILCLALVATAGLAETGAALGWNRQRDRQVLGFDMVTDWIKRHTEPSAVVMAQFPLDFELTTGRRGAVLPVTSNRQVLTRALRASGARYLVISDYAPDEAYYFPLETDRLAMIHSALRDRLVLRERYGDVTLYEILSESGSRATAAGTGPSSDDFARTIYRPKICSRSLNFRTVTGERRDADTTSSRCDAAPPPERNVTLGTHWTMSRRVTAPT